MKKIINCKVYDEIEGFAWREEVPQNDGTVKNFDCLNCCGSIAPKILDLGSADCCSRDVLLHCARLGGWTTLTACMEFCPRYDSCNNVAWADDFLWEYEGGRE